MIIKYLTLLGVVKECGLGDFERRLDKIMADINDHYCDNNMGPPRILALKVGEDCYLHVLLISSCKPLAGHCRNPDVGLDGLSFIEPKQGFSYISQITDSLQIL